MADHASRRNHDAASTSRSLLERIRADDSRAWNRLFTLYSPLVGYWCGKLAVPAQDVADIVQDVFSTVAKGIQSFQKKGPEDTFRGWLRTITRSRVIDWYRRNADRPVAAGGTEAYRRLAQQSVPELDDEDDQERQLTQQMYQRALSLIREHFEQRTWTAFWRVVMDNMTASEVGKELSMQPGAVRVAKSRVLNRLRRELGDIVDWQDRR